MNNSLLPFNFNKELTKALTKALTLIRSNHNATPIFYIEELGEFTGADGTVYLVDVTVRPKVQ